MFTVYITVKMNLCSSENIMAYKYLCGKEYDKEAKWIYNYKMKIKMQSNTSVISD